MIDVAVEHGTTRSATDEAIAKSLQTGEGLLFQAHQTFDWHGADNVDFTGVPYVEAVGAKMVGAHWLVHQPGGIVWRGGDLYQGDNVTSGALIMVRGDKARIDGLVGHPAAGRAFTVWQIAKHGNQAAPKHVRINDCGGVRDDTLDGFDVFCGEDIRVRGHHTTGGKDDGYVVKSIGAPTRDVHFSDCTVEDHAAVCGIGTQCYFPIENISWSNCVGSRVGHVIWFRPGLNGNAAPGGYVRNIRVSGVAVDDEDGQVMGNLLAFMAHTNMVMEDVKISNVPIRGRFKESWGRHHSFWSADEHSVIRNVELEGVKYTDPYGGAVNNPETPGHPLDRITNKGHKGQLDNIVYRDLRVNGMLDSALLKFDDTGGSVGDLWMADPLITNRQGNTKPLWDMRVGNLHLREL